MMDLPVTRLKPDLLKDLTPFAQLDDAQLRAVLDQSTQHRFANGTEIFAEGTPAERFFMLLDGYVRVTRTNGEGEQVIVLHIPSGNLFGIAPALGRDRYPASASAAGQVVALSWPVGLWARFAQDYPGMSQAAYATIGNRVAEMNTRIMELATEHVEQRVGRAILRMAQQSGRRDGAGIAIDFPITRQNIADMTGTTLFTVSRLLSAWDKDGVIESGRGRITLRRPSALLEHAGLSPEDLGRRQAI